MPNYYNPYNFYPATYANQMGYSGVPMQNPQMSQMPQQSYATPVQQGPKMMEWVEGEVGAKAFQMPNGWPANSPIPLWDSTDTVIYLKSWGPMGIPNPMQKLRYEMPEQQNQALLMSGDTGNGNGQSGHQDMSQYVTKQDFEQLKNEIRNMNQSGANGQNTSGNQNGNNSSQNGNRGGSR